MGARLITTCHYAAPCGTLLLGCAEGTLCLCDWAEARHHTRVLARLQHYLSARVAAGSAPTLQQAAGELDAFFAGKRTSFTTPLLHIGTAFQRAIWQELCRIPHGHTLSYAELASRLGISGATRAVANAVAANALSIFVPCHRVIGSKGRLTGYAGGLPAKSFLLELEGSLPPTLPG